MPGDLRDRITVFQKPRFVRAAPVIEQRVWIRRKHKVARSLKCWLGVAHLTGAGRQRNRGGSRWVREDTTALQRGLPEAGKVLVAASGGQSLPACLEMIFERWVGKPGERPTHFFGRSKQNVSGRERVEDRLHDGLHQAIDAGARAPIVPSLERMMGRKQ